MSELTRVDPVNEIPATFSDSQSSFPTPADWSRLAVTTFTTPKDIN